MCGIVGARDDWLRDRGLVPERAISAAVEDLRWRGPDSHDVTRAREWWLGCARLAISAGASQPVTDPAGRTTVVMNGAVTNARDLWRELSPGTEHLDVLPNDAALPGLAVSHGRLDLLAELRGHHAYAVADQRDGALYIGQDRYGERPLLCVIAQINQRWELVAFASTHSALRQLGVEPHRCVETTSQWFRYGWSEAAVQEVHAGLRVCELPARGVAYVARAGADDWATPVAAPAPAKTAKTADVTSLRERLTASVRRCIDSPSAAGLSLSGGVDSSCIALTLGELNARIPAYQFCASGAPTDERCAAGAVAEIARLELRPVNGGPEVLDALPELTRRAGQPLGDPSILAAHTVATVARADGVKILLGGEGADELLLGYRRYRVLASLPRAPRLRRLGASVAPWSMKAAARYLRAALALDPIRALLAVTPPAFGRQVLAPDLSDEPCWRGEAPMERAPRDLALAGRDDDLDHYLPRDLLTKLDVALLAAGVEGRCPYLEAGIEAFGQSRAAMGKRPLREAFAELLPKQVTRLPKRGFSLPLDAWFRGELAALDVLADRRSQTRPHLRAAGLARAVDNHRSGRAALGHGLYLLYAYEIHLRASEEAQDDGR